MPKLSAGNDDRAIVVATFCWTTVCSRPPRPPIREKNPLFVPWRDHDPSRIALSHGNGDFGWRAWRDHVELPDSAAELSFGCRGGLLARRFRCSRYDLGHTGDRQKPESGNANTETFCKKLHRHMQQCKSSAPNYRTLRLLVLAIFNAPPLVISLRLCGLHKDGIQRSRSTGSPIPPRFTFPANSIDPTAVDISLPLRLTPSIRGFSSPPTKPLLAAMRA
jgi:hypothetical protein